MDYADLPAKIDEYNHPELNRIYRMGKSEFQPELKPGLVISDIPETILASLGIQDIDNIANEDLNLATPKGILICKVIPPKKDCLVLLYRFGLDLENIFKTRYLQYIYRVEFYKGRNSERKYESFGIEANLEDAVKEVEDIIFGKK